MSADYTARRSESGALMCMAHGCPCAASIDATCRFHYGVLVGDWQRVTHYLRNHPREIRAADSLLGWGYFGPERWRDPMSTLNVPGARDAARDAKHAYGAGNWLIGAMLAEARGAERAEPVPVPRQARRENEEHA